MCLFPDFEYCKLNIILIPGISGNASAIGEKTLGTRMGARGGTPC